MAKFKAMTDAQTKQIQDAMKEIMTMIEAKNIHSLLVVGAQADGGMFSICGTYNNYTVAQLFREFLDTHMSCHCGDPACATELTKISLLQILDGYIGQSDKPQQKAN